MNEKIIDLGLLDHINKKVDDILDYLRNDIKKNPISEWMDAEETMFLIKCSPRSLQTYRDQKLLEFSRLSKKKIFYKRSSVLALLESKLNQ